MSLNRIKFMNTYIDNISMKEAILHIENCVKSKKICHIITPNVDQIVEIEKNIYFRKICSSCELLLVDGHPLLWIAKLYRTPLKEKICGSDLVPKLCQLSVQKGYSIYLLGAAPGVAQIAADKLKQTYPGLSIAGCYSPPMNFENDKNEIEKINNLLKSSGADMLFVGLGAPKQDIFIYENMHKYQIPVSFSIGASIDFIAGVQRRAPKWMRNAGLEWFFRLITNPKRMFKRYILNDLIIFKLFFKYK